MSPAFKKIIMLLLLNAVFLPAFADTTIIIENYAFIPNTVTITAGERVVWMNQDKNMQYRLDSDDKSIASNFIITGGTYFQGFNVTGTYHYYAANFPTMTGTIVVQPVNTFVNDKVKSEVKKQLKIQMQNQGQPVEPPLQQ